MHTHGYGLLWVTLMEGAVCVEQLIRIEGAFCWHAKPTCIYLFNLLDFVGNRVSPAAVRACSVLLCDVGTGIYISLKDT